MEDLLLFFSVTCLSNKLYTCIYKTQKKITTCKLIKKKKNLYRKQWELCVCTRKFTIKTKAKLANQDQMADKQLWPVRTGFCWSFLFFFCLFFFPAILKIEFPNQAVSAAAGPNVKSANSLLKHPGRRQPSALSNPWGDSWELLRQERKAQIKSNFDSTNTSWAPTKGHAHGNDQ